VAMSESNYAENWKSQLEKRQQMNSMLLSEPIRIMRKANLLEMRYSNRKKNNFNDQFD